MKVIPAAAAAVGLLALALAFALTRGEGREGRDDPAVGGSAVDGMYAALERQVARRPGDERAWVLKARADMQAGRFELAAAAYARAVAVGRKVARDPGVWTEYAEARGMAQGGTLVGEPLRLVEQALALDPLHVPALDLAGSAAWEAQDYRVAALHWKRLRQQLPIGSARHREVAAAVERAEQRAAFTLPPPR